MNICYCEHDEVCFEGERCPVCEKKREYDALFKQKEQLEIELDNLKINFVKT